MGTSERWFSPSTINSKPSTFSQPSTFPIFEALFGAGGFLVPAFQCFLVPLADLLLDLFADEINRGVEIALAVLGKEVRPAHAQADGAGELFFRRAGVVVFQGDAGV